MFDLTTRDIKYLSGVGPQKAAVLNKELEIYSLHDLLYYFPYKYVDRSRIYYIHEIDGNMPYIQLKGKILGFETFGEGRQRRLLAHFSDGTGVVDLVWFQGIKYVTNKYKLHEEYIVFGKPTVFNGRINVAHPDIDSPADLKLSSMGLQPYYNTRMHCGIFIFLLIRNCCEKHNIVLSLKNSSTYNSIFCGMPKTGNANIAAMFLKR